MLPTCLVAGKKTIQENEELDGIVSNNRKYKIQFIRDDLNKESLDDILAPLEMHHSGYIQRVIIQLWPLFKKEHARYNLKNLTI